MLKSGLRITLLALTFAAVLAVAAPGAQAAQSCLTPVASDDNEPPCNPFLATTVWSESHRNSYAQASSPFPGPEPGDTIAYENQLGILGVPIVVDFTEPYADGGRAVWFSVVATPDGETVYKADFETGQVIDRLGKQDKGEVAEPGTGGVPGAYNILDHRNRLIVGRSTRLDVYKDAVKGDRFSDIKEVKRFQFPAKALCGPDDNIVGAAMLWDGTIAFASELGVVGTVPGQPRKMKATKVQSISLNGDRCATATGDDSSLDQVSNSIAADEDGGIYVVTSQGMYKFHWDGKKLGRTWRSGYKTGAGSGVRLGDGSGSTPSLMGTDARDDRFVVITDGQDLMHLVLMWRDKIPPGWEGLPGRPGRIACEIPVTFGDPQAQESLSEQSVMVRGNAAIVVNNKLQNEEDFENLPPNQRIIAAALAGQDPANAPYGLERFDWDPKSRSCGSTWANDELSIPNGIPSMSTATNLIYGIGQRNGKWGLEGVDFDTGASKLRVPSSSRPTDNSFYAATTVGPDGAIWTGTFTGFTIFRPGTAKPAPEFACKDVESPTSEIKRKRSRLNNRRVVVRGRAGDRACGQRSRGTVRGTAVSIARKVKGGCRHLRRLGGFTRKRACDKPRWIKSRSRRGGERFRLRLRVRLPAGRYRVTSRATDEQRNREAEGDLTVRRLRVR